jgi:hypothetical protein
MTAAARDGTGDVQIGEGWCRSNKRMPPGAAPVLWAAPVAGSDARAVDGHHASLASAIGGSPAAAAQELARHRIQAGTVSGFDQHAQSGEHCDAEGARRELERMNPAGQQHRHHGPRHFRPPRRTARASLALTQSGSRRLTLWQRTQERRRHGGRLKPPKIAHWFTSPCIGCWLLADHRKKAPPVGRGKGVWEEPPCHGTTRRTCNVADPLFTTVARTTHPKK